jgi:uncharacterized protein (TIGR03118 family)
MRLRIAGFTIVALMGVMMFSQAASAQYASTALVSNQTGKAKNTDKNLVNAWGIAYATGGDFWVSDTGTGLSTLYNGMGVPQSTVVTIPPASGTGQGTPTGIVSNSTSSFEVSNGGTPWPAYFLFATLDGTISGWTPLVSATKAVIAVNNSSTNASYTGLAISTTYNGNEPAIFAADSFNNKVDIYNGSFDLVGTFTDSTVPPGFAVFNAQNVKGMIFVTYVSTSGGAGGYVDILNGSGVFVKRFASGTPLNQPWGVAIAPSNFGTLSSTILIGNNTSAGEINGFNAKTGAFVGTVTGTNAKPITVSQLWAITFGGGSANNGETNQLFYTAGPSNYEDGLLGVIVTK